MGVGGNSNGLLYFLCRVNYPNTFFDKPDIREKCHKQNISLLIKNDWIKCEMDDVVKVFPLFLKCHPKRVLIIARCNLKERSGVIILF